MNTAIISVATAGAISGQAASIGAVYMIASGAAQGFDFNAFLVAFGSFVAAIAGATVAVLAALDRHKFARGKAARLSEAQIEWLRLRLHDVTLSAIDAGCKIPEERTPYPPGEEA